MECTLTSLPFKTARQIFFVISPLPPEISHWDSLEFFRGRLGFYVFVSLRRSILTISIFFSVVFFIGGTGCPERNARLQKFRHRVAIGCFRAPFSRVTSRGRDKLKLSYLNFSQRATSKKRGFDSSEYQITNSFRR